MTINYNTKKWTKQTLSDLINQLESEKEILSTKNRVLDDENSNLITKGIKLKKQLDAALEPKVLCLVKSEIQISNENLDQLGNHTKQKVVGPGTKWFFNKSEAERLKGYGSVDILYEVSPENFLSKLEEIESNFHYQCKILTNANNDSINKLIGLSKTQNELEDKNRDLQQENNQMVNMLNHLNSKNTDLEAENKQLTQDVIKLVRMLKLKE